MTKEEISYLLERIANSWADNQRYTLCSHTVDRLHQKRIKFCRRQFTHAVTHLNDCLIEYNCKIEHIRHSERVVLRSTLNSRRQQCYVIDLDSFTIVTIYENDCNDSHATLDTKRYNKKLKIIQ